MLLVKQVSPDIWEMGRKGVPSIPLIHKGLLPSEPNLLVSIDKYQELRVFQVTLHS